MLMMDGKSTNPIDFLLKCYCCHYKICYMVPFAIAIIALILNVRNESISTHRRLNERIRYQEMYKIIQISY